MVRSTRAHRPRATLLSSLLLLVATTACRDDESPPEARSDESVASELDPTMTPYFERVRDDVNQLMKLVRMQPDNAALRVDLGRKLLEGGLPAAGERHLKRALQLEPTLVEAREVLARNLYERQEADDAVRLIEEGLRLEESAPLYALLGTVLLSRGPESAERARGAYDRALTLDGRCVEAAYERARIAVREGDTSLAVTLLERVLSLQPTHLGAHFNLAQVVRRGGDSARADALLATHRRLAALEDLGQLDAPEAVEAYIALGEMRIDGGAVDEGLDELRAGVARHPREPIVRVRLALALAGCGRDDEARLVFDRALKEITREPMLLNQYAWFLATRGKTAEDRGRALALAEKAIRWSSSPDPNLFDTLAEARLVTGDVAGALAASSQALRLRPGDPEFERRHRRFARAAEGDE